MRQEYPFRVDNRPVIKHSYCSEVSLPLESFLLRGDGSLNFAASPSLSLSRAAAADSSDWQRVAGLVQSPVSANSEGSSTSTPDQCPASPALTFCEMPSSRNGSCNNSLSEMQQQQHVWKALSSQQAPVSLSPSSQAAQPVSSSVDRDGTFFSDQTGQPGAAAWNRILSHSDMSPGALGLSRGLILAQSCAQAASPQLHSHRAAALSESQRFGSVYPVELQASASASQAVKQEEEYFLGGRNGLVIDDKLLSLQRSGTSSTPACATTTSSSCSKIGNFMDLLRQSDKPITDATIATAASCSHLSQLLTGHEAPEMWIAHSTRLPAMLSEVMTTTTPSNSSGRCSDPFELRNKRKAVQESSASDVDDRGPGSTLVVQQQQHQQQQHHEGRKSLRDQDEDDSPSSLSERLTTVQGTSECELFSKRPKIENSNFPFKMQVRKEKLGERISALQQLVSPFGKTDTASVLLEAIGYIKFLHEQVQVLSSPYLKHNAIRHSEHGQETKHDLRSRGLCLMPVSCTLRVANDNGADYWTPTLHGGLK